jgi:hypothetical protein
MCDPAETTTGSIGVFASQQGQAKPSADYNLKQAADFEPSLRDRLEAKRNRLTRELVQVEQALHLVYSNPDAEKNYEILRRARP